MYEKTQIIKETAEKLATLTPAEKVEFAKNSLKQLQQPYPNYTALFNVIENRIEAEKQQNILTGSKIRRIKQLINKFNNFNNHDLNKFNKAEHRKYKHLKGVEFYTLNSRFNVINDITNNLETIQKMGFSLYYYIDNKDAKNNDFIFGLSSGALRGLKVFEPFKYEKYEYEILQNYNDIYKLAYNRDIANKNDIKFSLNGFNFTADALGHDLILHYMAEKKRSPH